MITTKASRGVLSTLLLGLLVAACTDDYTTTRPPVSTQPASPEGHCSLDRYAMLEAEDNLRVLRAFSDGLPTDEKLLAAALEYFLLNMDITVDRSYDGQQTVPTPRTKDDLSRLAIWLQSHGHRLRWNEGEGRVRVVSKVWVPRPRNWDRDHALGLAFWQRQLGSIVKFAKDREEKLAFSRACEVFRELTGVDVDWDGDFFGLTVTKQTLTDIESLRLWYREHCARLYWNEATGELKLDQEGNYHADPACSSS